MSYTPNRMSGRRPLEAWEAVSPDEGMTTRRRKAKMESASRQSQPQSSEVQGPHSSDAHGPHSSDVQGLFPVRKLLTQNLDSKDLPGKETTSQDTLQILPKEEDSQAAEDRQNVSQLETESFETEIISGDEQTFARRPSPPSRRTNNNHAARTVAPDDADSGDDQIHSGVTHYLESSHQHEYMSPLLEEKNREISSGHNSALSDQSHTPTTALESGIGKIPVNLEASKGDDSIVNNTEATLVSGRSNVPIVIGSPKGYAATVISSPTTLNSGKSNLPVVIGQSTSNLSIFPHTTTTGDFSANQAATASNTPTVLEGSTSRAPPISDSDCSDSDTESTKMSAPRMSAIVNPENQMPENEISDDTIADNEITENEIADNEIDEDASSHIASDVSVEHGEEALNQLRARNEDLQSTALYFRLMAEIALKASSLCRGYTRSPLPPPNLKPHLHTLHQHLMFVGLDFPITIATRGHTISDVIELHLTWELHNLGQSISPSAAVNSFIEFAAVFLPQLQRLSEAVFPFTDDDNASSNTTTHRLLCWILEQTALLAETVAPTYLATTPLIGWTDDALRPLWDLDTLLLATSLARVRAPAPVPAAGPGEHVPLIPPPVPHMHWANAQLAWVNRQAGRLERSVGLVPNHAGVLVPLFGLTRGGLRDWLWNGQAAWRAARG